MPPLPPASKTLRVDLHFGTHVLSRLHLRYTGGAPSAADCVSLAQGVSNAFNTYLKPWLTNNGELVDVYVLDLDSTSGNDGTYTGSVVGTRTGASLPQGVAVLINHKISRRYRGGKPRTYLPFFSSSDTNGVNGWQSTSVSSLQTAWDNFVASISAITAGTTTTSALVNVSYYSGKVLRSTPVVDTITSSTVKNVPASQRRRNGKT